MKELVYKLSISDEAFELLQKIEKHKCAEYRDPEFSTLEEFKMNSLYLDRKRDEEWFLNRNFGGTYYLIEELLKHNLIDDDMAWNITYRISSLGKEVLKSYRNTSNKACETKEDKQ